MCSCTWMFFFSETNQNRGTMNEIKVRDDDDDDDCKSFHSNSSESLDFDAQALPPLEQRWCLVFSSSTDPSGTAR